MDRGLLPCHFDKKVKNFYVIRLFSVANNSDERVCHLLLVFREPTSMINVAAHKPTMTHSSP